MKINKLYMILVVVFASLATTACFDDPGTTILWDGVQVEWQNANLPNGVTRNFVRNSPTQTDVSEIQVNLVAPAQNQPVTITIAVDPTSTAIEGVHYELTGGTSITIPAGENVVNYPVTVLTGGIDPTETPDLILTMTSATGAAVSTNYNTLEFKIRVICPSELQGTWAFENGNDVTITSTSTGVYRVDNLNRMGGYFAPSNVISGNFSDFCNTLTLFGTTEFGVEWRGTGEYDPETDTILWESIEDLTYGGGFQRTNVLMTRVD